MRSKARRGSEDVKSLAPLYVCRLACICRQGTSEMPPYVPYDGSRGLCPHALPHVETYMCASNEDGCGWSEIMGMTGNCLCIPENAVRTIPLHSLADI